MTAAATSREVLLDLQRRMLEIRAFEDAVMRLFMQNLVRGSTHLYQGQEAVAVGACSALRSGDTIACTYRGHGAVLAMGAPLDRAMGEILGKHKGLYPERGEVELGTDPMPLGAAEVVREGSDVTLVATQLMRGRALEAADALAGEVDVEVVDPHTLRPLDVDTIAASVEKTSRLLCVQECPASGSWGATVVAEVVERCWESLDARPRLLSADDTPIPYAGPLESAWMPTAESIAAAVRALARD